MVAPGLRPPTGNPLMDALSPRPYGPIRYLRGPSGLPTSGLLWYLVPPGRGGILGGGLRPVGRGLSPGGVNTSIIPYTTPLPYRGAHHDGCL